MKSLIFIAGMALSMQAAAQMGMGLTYRAGDPFLFCHDGQDTRIAPARCWWPIPPYTGAYFPDPSCDPPDTYGRPWTQDDYNSLAQYLAICPQAMTSGEWGGHGQANMTPFSH